MFSFYRSVWSQGKNYPLNSSITNKNKPHTQIQIPFKPYFSNQWKQRLAFSETPVNGSQEVPTPTSLSFWQRFNKKHNAWEKQYEQFKKTKPATNELLQFSLRYIIYGVGAALVAYFFKDYLDEDKQIKEIALAIDNQSRENAITFEKIRILRAQPLLYLTTHLIDADKQDYHQTKAELTQRINQLNRYLEKLKIKKLAKRPFNHLIKILTARLEQEIEQLKLAIAFNETIWLQKNRQYKTALLKNEGIIKQLEGYQEKQVHTLFDLPCTLAAAYNAQAKLEACLAFFSSNEKDIECYRKQALDFYDKGIKVLRETLENPIELAILLSGKAYLLTDCGKPEEALKFHQEANALKPNDEHILCGIGLALYSIEKQKQELGYKLDISKLDEAYGYFTRSLQLNSQNANAYVSRGKLLLTLGEPQKALADFEKALEVDKTHTHSEAHIQKAYILLQQGSCDLAESYFKQGLLPLLDRPYEIHKQKEKLAEVEKKTSSDCHLLEKSMFFKYETRHAQEEPIKTDKSKSKNAKNWFK